MFTTNQITSALAAYRSAADQDTATASSIAAALLSYYTRTIAQVDGLLAGKLGVTEAALALQIAVRFPDDGGADEVVAAIGEQILGPTDVSLSAWSWKATELWLLERTRKLPSVVTRAPGARPRCTPNGVAKLHFGAHFQAPGLPNQTAGTVDVYGLQILDATLETGNRVEAEEDTAASALLLKHEFLDGGAAPTKLPYKGS